MIINLWSTPRTGSVWYSFHLASQYAGSMLITEMFNRYHMDMYHVVDHSGVIKNYHHWVDGGFYKEYYHIKNEHGISLGKRSVTFPRHRTIDQEEKYCFDLIRSLTNKNQILIFHNHVEPINNEIRNWLINNSERNIWIYRRDRRRQLASYAVARSTKQFAAFRNKPEDQGIVEDCEVSALTGLMWRIKEWDKLPKNEIIAFEDVDFYNKSGFPLDQNDDPWDRITDNMKTVINNLVGEYENNSNK